jgi:predicted O-methyltransferase YrrM
MMKDEGGNMKKYCVTFITFLGILVTAVEISGLAWAEAPAARSVFRIPRLDGIVIDGNMEDWGDRGFRVDFIAAPDGRVLPPDDFDVKFRLGWNPQGLLVWTEVLDDVPVEHANRSRLWQRDCVELFISQAVGSTHRCQVVVASGRDPAHGKMRQQIYDWRLPEQKTEKLSAQVSSRWHKSGYAVEAFLPWDNVGVNPELGMEIGFQFIANDNDGPGDVNGPLRVAWFPAVGPGSLSKMYSLKLSKTPSDRVSFRIQREITSEGYSVSIQGTEELLGRPVTLKSENRTMIQSKMEERAGRANQIFRLDTEAYPDFWPRITVLLGEQTAGTYEELPTLQTVVRRYIEAVGGQEILSRLRTRVCEGHFVDDLSWQEPRIKSHALKAFAQIPDMWMTLVQTEKGSEQNGYDGIVGWKLNADRIERNDRARWSWLGFLLNPQGALFIQDYFPGLKLAGSEIRGEQEVFVVESSSGDGPQNRLTFDADTGLLVRIDQHWEITDYREVDGIQFPFKIATTRKGGESYFAFEKVEHNAAIDPAQFSMPEHQDIFAEAFEGLEESKVLPLLKCKGLTYTHEDMNVPVKDGRFLHDFIVEHSYKKGLEIGTFTGYSTLWMGLGFRKTGGELLTIEIDPSYGEVARENFQKAGLEDVIESLINDALEEIPQVEGTFDFVFIDAWKPDYLKYFYLLRERMRPGGAIIAHNVTNYARDMKDFLDTITNDPGLETTFNEISAEGMSISLVKSVQREYALHLIDRSHSQ